MLLLFFECFFLFLKSDNWADQPPEYNDKAHNSVGSFWSKSGVILLSLVITFITATIIASTLDNCKSSKELGSIVICDGKFSCTS